jgi:hypothetical protein
VNVRPGEAADAPKAITGMPLEFTVETMGAQPERVTLFTSRDGGKTFAEMEMKQGGSFADPWSVTIEKLPGELLYYMAGGDGRTKTYELNPVPVAIVEKISLDYDFPEYTAVPRREGVEEGNIEALQGTWITVTATTNQPARSGFLDFKPNPPVPLAVTPGNPRLLTGKFLVESNGQYAVRYNSVDGQANPEPVIYDIKVVKDLSPTARFIRPESPAQRPANARVPLVIEASDDFGLKSVQLHVHKNGEILQQAEELIDQKSAEKIKQLQRTVSLDLQPLSLKPGDKVQYWLTLRDNCDLQPNKFETPKQVIEILDPISQPQREELAQNEMAQAREQTGQQEPMNQQNQGQGDQQNQENGENQQNNQQPQGKQGDRNQPEEKKEQQKQQGKGKNSQGDASEAADPSDNAKEGGKEAPNAKPQPSDATKKNQSQSKSKNAGQTGGSTENDPQNKQAGEKGSGNSENQPENKQGNQPDNKQESGKNQQKNAGDNSQPQQKNGGNQQPDMNQPTNNPQNKSGDAEKSAEKSIGKSAEKAKNGENKSGQQGEKPNDPMNADNQPMPGENNPNGENSQPRQGQPKAGENGQPKQGDQQKPGENQKNESNRLPDGNPDEVKNGDPSQNQPRDMSSEDRQKLDKLRQALGLDKEPQSSDSAENKPEGQKPNEPMNADGQPGEEKSGDTQKQGDQQKSGGSQSKSGNDQQKQGGDEKNQGDQQKSGGDQSKEGNEQKSGENKKSGGDPSQKSDDPQNKSGDQPEKSGGDQQKQGEGQKSGDDQQKQGDDQQKQGDDQQKTGNDQKKSGGDESKQGDNQKSGGDQPKQGDQQKQGGDQQKSGNDQKKSGGDQPKGKGQGDDPNGNQPEDQEKGKSEKAGEEKGRPGELPKGQPKSGGMREGNANPEQQPDTSEASPRSQEPDQPGESNNLTPQQKADQRLLKRLREMVKRDEITKDIEQATGLSREEIDQFVRRYEPPAKDDRTRTGEGPGEILTKQSGDEKERRVNLPANLPGGQVTSRSARNSGMVGDDAIGGNLEGARSRIPSALRARFEAYQKSLSRAGSGPAANSSAPAPAPASSPSPAPAGGQPGSR